MFQASSSSYRYGRFCWSCHFHVIRRFFSYIFDDVEQSVLSLYLLLSGSTPLYVGMDSVRHQRNFPHVSLNVPACVKEEKDGGVADGRRGVAGLSDRGLGVWSSTGVTGKSSWMNSYLTAAC